MASLVHQIIQGLVGRGYGDQDFAALLELQAESAGLHLVSEDVEVSDGLEPGGRPGSATPGETKHGEPLASPSAARRERRPAPGRAAGLDRSN